MIVMGRQTNAPLETAKAVPQTEVRRKVVIRYASGDILRGFLAIGEEGLPTDSSAFVVEGPSGGFIEANASELKAIFFVKSFEGSRDYSEFKVFRTRPNEKGVWVRVRFRDGEEMEGVTPNCLDTYTKSVFHMSPPDPASNNQVVLVSKSFLKEMRVLGLASD